MLKTHEKKGLKETGKKKRFHHAHQNQRYTYKVLQAIQMKLILLWVWAEQAVWGRAKTALKFKF